MSAPPTNGGSHLCSQNTFRRRRLPIPVAAKPGEGLAELIQRAAAENFYHSSSYVLLSAGLDWLEPAGIATGAIGHEKILAEVLGLPQGEADLTPLLHPPVPDRPGWIGFFGTTIRAAHKSVFNRRISPRSLRRSLHGRAIWSLKCFSFDPATKEKLLDACPECTCTFGYKWTRGLQYCEHCTAVDAEGFLRGKVDLRDYPQPFVEVNDVEALDFVTGLIDPDPDVRAAFCPCLHADLQSFDRSALFELALALACAITANPSHSSTSLHRPATTKEYARFQPEALASAGRTLLSWPAAFHDLAERIRSQAPERPGHFGLKKELGPLVALTMDAHVDPELRMIVRTELQKNMTQTASTVSAVRRVENRHRSDLITIQEASQEFNVGRKLLSRLAQEGGLTAVRSPRAKKAPVLLVEREIKNMIELREKLVPSSTVAIRLGVPKVSLRALSEKTCLLREEGSLATVFLGHDYYHRSSVDELVDKVMRVVSPGQAPQMAVRISKAVNRLGIAEKNPWPVIFEAIIDRQVPVWRVEGRLSALMTSLAVSGLGPLENLMSSSGLWDAQADEIIMTQSEAACLLGTSVVAVTGLVDAGLLPRGLRRPVLERFATEFMFTLEIQRRMKNCGVCLRPRDIPTELRRRGIEPVAVLKYGGTLVWPRAAVEVVLSSWT